MRRFYGFNWIIFILFGVTVLGADSSFDGLFTRGNSSFEDGDYESALDAYSTIIKQGGESIAVYYNLGNSYLKSGDIGHAIWSYRRAQRMDPGDEDVLVNLDLARSLVKGKVDSEEANGFKDKLLTIAESLGAFLLTAVTGFLWLVVCSLMIWTMAVRLKRTRRVLMRLTVIIMIMFLGTGTLLGLLIIDHNVTEYAVAIGDSIIARNGPGDHFTEVYRQQQGYEMKVLRRQAGWAEVKLNNGYTGWVPNQTLVTI